MEEENKNEEIIEQSIQDTEPVIEEIVTEEVAIEENQTIAQVDEQILQAEQIQKQNTDIGFEPVIAPKKPQEQKPVDYDMVSVSPVEFVSFDNDESHLSDDAKANLDIMQDVKMHITVELGRAKSSVKKILDLTKGSIVELNKVAGEQVELYANGKFIAYGEVIVIEDKFGLRVTNVSHQNIHNL